MRLEDIIAFKKKGYEGRTFIMLDQHDRDYVIQNNTLLAGAYKWYSLTGLAIRYLKWRYK